MFNNIQRILNLIYFFWAIPVSNFINSYYNKSEYAILS